MYTDLSSMAPATQQATFPSIIPKTPVFTRDLSPNNYFNEEGEVTLTCSVISADTLTFRCLNVRLPENKQVWHYHRFLTVYVFLLRKLFNVISMLIA